MSAPEAAPVRIAHVAPTPLVRAPERLSEALNRAGGFSSTAIVLADYPGELGGKFIQQAILWPEGRWERPDDAAAVALREADIIHVHNRLPAPVALLLARVGERARFVYQVHSPLREGPLYTRADETMGLPFERLLAVCHIHPRLYDDHIPVPNIIDAPPSLVPLADGQKPRVLYCPSHPRPGRWNGKHSQVLEDLLRALDRAGDIEAVIPERKLSPYELMTLRRTTHISIDEILTGGFHQVSLEGLCAGNVVINNADHFSCAMLQEAADARLEPPFVRMSESLATDRLRALVRDPDRIRALQRASFEYFRDRLRPERLVRRFTTLYEAILDG